MCADVLRADAPRAGRTGLRQRRGSRNLCRIGGGRLGMTRSRRCGYILLETVVATGLLIVGLAVIGAQIQDGDAAVKRMERKVRAVMLADLELAKLDMGVEDLKSFDNIEEGDFGPRYPDFGWRLTTDPTGLADTFALTLEVLHHYRDGAWKPNNFDYDAAEVVFTTHALQTVPVPFDLERDFGLPKDQLEDVSKQLADLSIPGLDVSSLNQRTLASLNFEDFVRALPVLAEVFGFDINAFTGALPPELRSLLEQSGLTDGGNGPTDNPQSATDAASGDANEGARP